MSKYDIKRQIEVVSNGYKNIKAGERNISKQMVKDSIMSGIAMFSLKYPSLLQFEQSHQNEREANNLKILYKVEKAPSDTYMREVLDEINPKDIRTGFTRLFRMIQTGKKLQNFAYYNEHYLLSIDGTGHFSSHKIKCKNCCKKQHKNGSVTYHHNLVAGALVNPDIKAVIPICPEPIQKQDGNTKNDCELNAVTRLILDYRREHPHLKTIVIEDGLFGKAPHIQLLKNNKLSYIIGVKSTDHAYLFQKVEASEYTKTIKLIDNSDTRHVYRFLNQVSLNRSNIDQKVNFLEYTEIKADGSKRYFSWVTDIQVTPENMERLMKAARARWKIENETFNTLKNQGYQFEHNFGHGKKNLCTVLSFLMMLAFLIDQIQLHGSVLFQKALKNAKSKTRLWFKLRSLFSHYVISSWDNLLLSIAHQPKPVELIPDTS